ncbi:hypothetical protein EMGBD2_08660 [Nitrospirota bacterium]|nr:hypothetical protein EMGBD2_08660 [Nitrospirota bacterium]
MIEAACAKVGGVPTASVVRGLLATRGSMSLPRFLTPRHGCRFIPTREENTCNAKRLSSCVVIPTRVGNTQ